MAQQIVVSNRLNLLAIIISVEGVLNLKWFLINAFLWAVNFFFYICVCACVCWVYAKKLRIFEWYQKTSKINYILEINAKLEIHQTHFYGRHLAINKSIGHLSPKHTVQFSIELAMGTMKIVRRLTIPKNIKTVVCLFIRMN